MDHFVNKAVLGIFKKNKLANFQQIWNLELDWFEPVNKRRKGWSGVSQYTLIQNAFLSVFIKRQQNHNTFNLFHPIKGIPTFQREYKNIRLLQALKIPTLVPLYYGERRLKDNCQAILITEALSNFQDMFNWYQNCQHRPDKIIKKTLYQVARQIRFMHDQNVLHCCLYPNHIFIKQDTIDAESEHAEANPIRFIDLEKVRQYRCNTYGRYRDLECFLRHAKIFAPKHLRYLLEAYFSETDSISKSLMLNRLNRIIEHYEKNAA